MFQQIRRTLVLAVAGLCTAAIAASSGFALPQYDSYYDALRVAPTASNRAPASLGTAAIVKLGSATYDPYLDALRVTPHSTITRRLAIGKRTTAKGTVLRPCGRCQ